MSSSTESIQGSSTEAVIKTDCETPPSTALKLVDHASPTTTNETSNISTTTPDPSGESLKEFHLFPKLCRELQLQIWSFCTPPPYTFKYDEHPEKKTCFQLWGDEIILGFWRPPPAILHACRDSRAEFIHKEGVERHHPTYKWYHFTTTDLTPLRVWVSKEQDKAYCAWIGGLHP